jgi:subfamily B ATP-binding cassette protein HlyB/CyaB
MPTPQQHLAMASHLMPSPQEVDIGLVCLLLLPRSFVIAAASKQIRHEFGLSRKPCWGAEVWCIARRLGLKAGKHSATWAHLGILPLPAIAQYTDRRYVILGQVDGECVLVQDSRASSPLVPLVRSRHNCEAAWNETLRLLTMRSRLRSTVRKFDVTWFLPASIAT